MKDNRTVKIRERETGKYKATEDRGNIEKGKLGEWEEELENDRGGDEEAKWVRGRDTERKKERKEWEKWGEWDKKTSKGEKSKRKAHRGGEREERNDKQIRERQADSSYI